MTEHSEDRSEDQDARRASPTSLENVVSEDFLRGLSAVIARAPDPSSTDSTKWKECESYIARAFELRDEKVVVGFASKTKHIRNRLRQRSGEAVCRVLLVQDESTATSAERILEDYRSHPHSIDARVVLLLRSNPAGAWKKLLLWERPVTATDPNNAIDFEAGNIHAPRTHWESGHLNKKLEDAADDLYVPAAWLKQVMWLLEDKKGVVLYGPPGTGKTYLAQSIARLIQPNDSFRRTVQLHPSYGYEDFFEGFRPVQDTDRNESGALLALRAGPLRDLSNALAASGDEKGILVVDEMNRGNLAAVFGELYFLLEYRNEALRLMYSPQEHFRLPEGLLILGTMNTADRSVALLDQALRRRFHFVPLFADQEPVKGMLRRYLADNVGDEFLWVADVLDRANSMLDRNSAIGPSHFMRPDLDEHRIEMIWRHSVIPTIEEHFFGQPERLMDFDLEKLRAGPAAAPLDPAS